MRYKVKAIIDPLAGFCGGVQRAIELVEKALGNGEELAVKGELIHNRLEVQRLYTLGLESIQDLEDANGRSILVRTHGEEVDFFQKAKELDVNWLDATCPKVMRSQKVIQKAYSEGKQIIIVGQLNHPEVIALQGHCNNDAIVVDKDGAFPSLDVDQQTLLIAQTTVAPETFLQWQERLHDHLQNLEVFDSRCSFVNRRQNELSNFAAEHPGVIFVGGRHSSNTRLLFNICRQINPSTFFVEDETELDWEWLSNFNEVGISGSASTPMWLLKRVAQAVTTHFE
ncbi:4-hydroxy-3-methylbut-2-enyl diphosphate reductase [candidate division LCP-89 bacterium B3_LCP]|uniref:4-hydroxy-3-methylbut-2-enyl diphosphate reductase n=1 Tax=candidate division LCP-89 bacterium B3_LCP TaxID=2012998 RepID=A0A532UZK0_UNCL8|nr:MAG: 4-hydroxy-3-methylbut-2-enyl diphosphate reductase [candidate division LCP-89 bacterium B3_LCP]